MVQQVKCTRPALKICGVTTERDAGICLTLGIDYVGFNFHPGSKRFISPVRAAEVWDKAVKNQGDKVLLTQPVAVFVDAAPAALTAALSAFPALACLQFHGSETAAALAGQAPLCGERAVWKALAVRGAGDIAAAAAFAKVAGLVLFDGVAAGTGQPFDWRLLAGYTGTLPFGVAGGIRPGTLAALAPYRPTLVDLCSGVEETPGVKSPELLRALWREHQAVW